jgi:hypothetical protein
MPPSERRRLSGIAWSILSGRDRRQAECLVSRAIAMQRAVIWPEDAGLPLRPSAEKAAIQLATHASRTDSHRRSPEAVIRRRSTNFG